MTERWTDNPRLVAAYDVECAGRWDHDFYLDRARALGAHRLADVGCGTGVFAIDAAERGHSVIAVDPSAAMLDRARQRASHLAIDWRLGGADSLPDASADLVVMMGHVAQYFVTDEEWQQALADCHRALGAGGHLTFESRNPAAREWETWTEAATRQRYDLGDGDWFESWVVSTAVHGDPESPTETHEGHTVFADDQHVVAEETLRFRTAPEITASLAAAGFEVVEVAGKWDGSPYVAGSPEIIVLARRSG